MNVLRALRSAFAAAAPQGADPDVFAAAVRPATDPKFGDYQANGCMAIAKQNGLNPRQVAQEAAEKVGLEPLAGKPEVAGPGFLNVRLHDHWLSQELVKLLGDGTLGLGKPDQKATVVIDFSSPNVAKPMHVGHVRSTVIGESLARLLEALGWHVVRDNHLGDWGAQFGMILWAWKNHRDEEAYRANSVLELSRLYKLAQNLGQTDKTVAEACRVETAKLHAGDPENRALWGEFMPHCLESLEAIYKRLGVTFDVSLGESFYDLMLASVVEKLQASGVATASEGATVVFTEGSKAPFIIRKRDGAFTYATTDLATIDYRVRTWNPKLVLYVVDHRQSDHFKQLFAVAKLSGLGDRDLRHVAFGTILGPDRKPYKTREGDVVGLESLLDEAVARARTVVDENSPELGEVERAKVAEIVGLGAVKYADLSQNRQSDYVFDWEKMLAMNGNTAAYLQYAYARIQSIFRRGEVHAEGIVSERPPILLGTPAERNLAVKLLRLPETLELAASELKPNILTDYLFELANAFSTFFDACPVLKAESEEVKKSRLAICLLVARTLRFGLGLLGIDVSDRM